MTRISGLILIAALAVAACTAPTRQLGPDGLPLPEVYVIKKADEGRVTFSMVDSVNELRRAAVMETRRDCRPQANHRPHRP